MNPHLMIEAEGLSKRYGETQAVDDVDLEVVAGSILGVLGPNGAGKTTALRIFTTLSTPDSGRARVAGHDVVAEPAAVRRKIGVTGQDATLDELLTGRQNLMMVGELSRLGRSGARRRTAELLEMFELTDAADRVVKGYSGGMRRRLDLAASLVMRPPVLFLDEPTTGLDPTSRQRMWGVIRGLVDDGATVLLTTQYLDEADTLADDIVVFDHGRVIARGTPEGAQVGHRVAVARGDARRAAPGSGGRHRALQHRRGHERRGRPAALDAGAQRARARGRRAPGSRRRRRAGRRHHRPPADARRRLRPAHRRRGAGARRVGGAGMSATATLTSEAGAPTLFGRVGAWWEDVRVMTWRYLIHVRRDPMQLSDVTIQPVLFTLLFCYVFGAAMKLPGGVSYTQFAIAGLLVMNLTTSAVGTAIGLSTDLSTGVISRLRTLPMASTSILVGRSRV